MKWKRIGIEDKGEIDKYLKKRFITSDYNFTTQFLWSDGEKSEYKIENNILFVRGTYNNSEYYYMPVPLNEDVNIIELWKKSIKNLMEINKKIILVPDYFKILLEDTFILEERRESFDYIYDSSDLAFLKGRKYAKKKNRISNFMRNYDYTYESINHDNINEVIEFQNLWYNEKNDGSEILKNEHQGIIKILNNFHKLDIFGGILKVEKNIIGYSIGEKLNDDYGIVHIEKALSRYVGSYQILNKLFAEKEFSNLKFINREDDFGDLGLREAKESYHPSMLLKKYEIIGYK